MTRVTLATANTPGAVALLHLHGRGVAEVLASLTGRDQWQARRAALCAFAGIDEGLAVLIDDDNAQLMPHGGPRVVQQLIAHLTGELGCVYDAEPDARAVYPEAGSPIEADMLDAMARAASPAAIDLLAAQPALWRSMLGQSDALSADQRQAIAEQTRTLDRLINPPTVVVAGPANAGKSTLANALMGRAVSLVADLPGTTRDWVGGLVELGTGCGVQGSADAVTDPVPRTPYPSSAVAVHWLDTPGLRESGDTVEQRAIALARQQIESADVLIAMRGVDQGWALEERAGRPPDLWVVNKADDAPAKQSGSAGSTADHPLLISAMHGIGLDLLQLAVLARLGLDSLNPPMPWAFSQTLRDAVTGANDAELAVCVGLA